MRLDVQDIVFFNFLSAFFFSYCLVFCNFTRSCLMFNPVFTSLFLSVYICVAVSSLVDLYFFLTSPSLILFLPFFSNPFFCTPSLTHLLPSFTFIFSVLLIITFPLPSFTSFCLVAAALSVISHSPLFCLTLISSLLPFSFSTLLFPLTFTFNRPFLNLSLLLAVIFASFVPSSFPLFFLSPSLSSLKNERFCTPRPCFCV